LCDSSGSIGRLTAGGLLLLATKELKMSTRIIDDIFCGDEVWRQALSEGQMLKNTSLRTVPNFLKLFTEVTGVTEEQISMDISHGGALCMALERFGTPVPPYRALTEECDGNLCLKQPREVEIHEQASASLYNVCLEEPDGNMWLNSQTSSLPQCTSSTLSGTTVMIRNVPSRYTPSLLMWELHNAGFMNQYDYLYIPAGNRKGKNRGFGFANFASVAIADRFRRMFDVATFSLHPVGRPLVIVPADVQGWVNNFQHQRAAPTHPFRIAPLFFAPCTGSRQVTSFYTKELQGNQQHHFL